MALANLTTGLKKCSKCQIEKPLKMFGSNKSRGDGLRIYCKKCLLIEFDPITNLENEVWKDVVGYEGLYAVSNKGRIKSLKRTVHHPINGKSNLSERLRTTNPSKDGYCHISLNKESIISSLTVHRIVAKAFIPNPQNKPQINHINGVRNDNRVENLEWVTGSENVRHAFKNGLVPTGEQHKSSKLTEEQVLKIRKKGKYKTRTQIAREYNVSFSCIDKIMKNKTWKHII